MKNLYLFLAALLFPLTSQATLGPITGTATTCIGSTTALSNATPGGTWSCASVLALVNATTGVLTGTGAGTAIVSYTAGTETVTTTVTINPAPAPIYASLYSWYSCTGDVFTLNNSTPGGTWSTTDPAVGTVTLVGADHKFNALAPGITTILYTPPGTACSSAQTITVNPVPAPIAGNLTLCAGGTTALSNPTPGGHWSSSDWGSVVSADFSTGIMTGIAAGTATVYYTLPNGCSSTAIAAVGSPTVAITGGTLLCTGLPATMHTAAAGGTWSSSSPATASVDAITGAVSAIAPGTVTISYNMAACSASVTATLSVSGAVPGITGTTAICSYGTSNLQDAMGGGTWTSSNTAVATVASSGLVTALSSGTTVISYNTGACGATSITMTVNAILPAITSSPGYLCGPGTVAFGNATAGGKWSASGLTAAIDPATGTPGTPVTGLFSIDSVTGVLTSAGSGLITVTYTRGGCGAYSYFHTYPSPRDIPGCDNLGIGDIFDFQNPNYSTWSSSNSTIASVDGSGRVTGIAVGTAIITNYSPYRGCIEGLKTITVTPSALVRPVTGFNLICQGGTVTLTDAVSGGTWASSDPAVATISSSGLVTGIMGGRTLISYSNTAGTAHCTREFFVNPALSTITGPTTICSDESVTLNAPTVPAYGLANTNFYPLNECNPGDYYWAWGYGPLPLVIDCGYYTPGSYYTSSDTSVVKTMPYSNNGQVWGYSPGTAVITFTDGRTHCSTSTTVTVNALTTAPITGTLTTCVGATTTLSCATTGGTWSTTMGFVATVGSGTGIVTGIAEGSAVITYATGSTCGRRIKFVNVIAGVPAIGGNPINMCVGATATLTNAEPGGTWSCSGAATIGASTGIVTATAPGTAVVTYTGGPCGYSVTTTITVTSSLSVTGVSNICAGTTTALTVATGAGTWSSSNMAVGTINSSGVLSGIAAGTTAVTFTSASCPAAAKVVTVYPISPISGPASICLASTATLSDAVTGGTWSSSNPYYATINIGGVASGLVTGYLTITYTAPTGCTATKNIQVASPPTTANVTGGGSYCIGGSGAAVGLSYSYPGTSYQLYNGTTAVGSALTGINYSLDFGLQTAGTYSVIATSTTTGCTATMNGFATVATVTSVPPITGTPIACISIYGTILSNALPGGTWSSSNTSAVTVNPTYGYIYGVDPGTSTISYTASCGTATMVVTAYALPPAITGTTTICQGSTTALSIAATGGTWSSGNPGYAPVDPVSGVVTGILPSYTSISYTAPTGCSSSIAVYVGEIPVITSPTPYICIGTTIPLSTYSYGVWMDGTPAVASMTSSGVITGVSLGTSIISYVSSIGCIGTYAISVTDACSGTPTAGTAANATSVITGGSPFTVTLTGASAACGISFQWQSSADGTAWTNIPGATAIPFHTYYYSASYYRCAVTCDVTAITSHSNAVLVSGVYTIESHNIVTSDTGCSNVHFQVWPSAYTTSLTVTTLYGDATSDNVPVSSSGAADIYHYYALPGSYTIKQILYNGTFAQDSVTFAYEHLYCRTLPIKFYQDRNTNCTFDEADNYNITPVTVEIDSNGIHIDTITVTSGLYRKTYGAPGTVYAFHVLSVSGGRIVACPSTAILFDTISATVSTYPVKYFGLQCGTSTTIDVAEDVSMTATTNAANGVIYISNSYCTPASPVVTMNMSPKYHYGGATPAPASVVGNSITWNLPPVSSAGFSVTSIGVSMYHTGTLIPGDTVFSDYQANPVTGDINTLNNYVALVNTITGSYDPNNIEVSPRGNILPCEQLLYTVNFENTGNDTARNIYVLDTLPANVIPGSLNVVMASAVMNVSVINDGTRNIARFDFPHINLLDSSHHNECHGMFRFTIKAKNPLADGVTVANKVGIYFDDNAAILTNTVTNIIGIAPVTGPGNVCAASTITLADATAGGTWSSSGAATVSGGTVTGTIGGTATISYTVSNSCASRTATKVVTVTPLAAVGIISGTTTLCAGATTILGNSASAGVWISGNPSVATISGTGSVNGIMAGSAVISYAVINSCGSALATAVVHVDPLPVAGPVAGPALLCIGSSATFGGTGTGGTWSGGTGIATVTAAGIVTAIAAGSSPITYSVTNGCGTDIATHALSVNPIVVPSASISTADTAVCSGITIPFAATPVGGGALPAYQWKVNGIATGTGATYSYLPANGDVVSVKLVSSADCALPDSATDALTMTVNTSETPWINVSASTTGAVCEGTPVTFTRTSGWEGSSPVFQWFTNAVYSGSGTTYSYPPTDGDVITCKLVSNYHCRTADTVTSSSTTIAVDPAYLPVVAIAANPGLTIVAGESDTLRALETGAGPAPTYQWMINGVMIAGATSDTYISDHLNNHDSVCCIVTGSGACAITSIQCVLINTLSSGVQTIADEGIAIFPNPTNGELTISGALPTGDKGARIEITNALGQMVYSGNINAISGRINEQIQLSKYLASGIYVLQVHTASGNKIIHFVLEQ